jgi:hypothetical protein
VSSQKAEGRKQKAEGRRQKAESRKQKAESRRQKEESRRQKARKTAVGLIELFWVYPGRQDNPWRTNLC